MKKYFSYNILTIVDKDKKNVQKSLQNYFYYNLYHYTNIEVIRMDHHMFTGDWFQYDVLEF